MTVDEIKEKVLSGEILPGLYSGGSDKIVEIYKNSFVIRTLQENGWTRLDIYEYLDNDWVYSESYEK